MAIAWVKVSVRTNLAFGQNRSGDVLAPAGSLTTDIAGSPTDLWGLILSKSDVENAGFGVTWEMEGASGSGDTADYTMDAVRIKVYYTVSGPSGPSPSYRRRSLGFRYG